MSRMSAVFLCGTFLLLFFTSVAWTQESGIFENFVEGYVKDLFTKELSSADSQNLTDCMTRLLCENICERTAKGDIKNEPLVNSAKMLGRTETDPLGYFFTGGDKGYEYGKLKQCHQCANKYPNCLPAQYEQAKSISGKYERNMLKPAESSVEGDFLEL